MPCHWAKLPGGGVVHMHVRGGKRPRCSYCADVGAQLECDGCDKPLCRTCSVSPRDGVDMCPRCFEPAWRHWLKLQPSSAGAMTQRARRLAFRRWARAGAEKFLELVPLGAVAKAYERSEQAIAAGHTPHALWVRAAGDPEKYRALMVEHGHLVAKETP